MVDWRRYVSTGGLVIAWTVFLVAMLASLREQVSHFGTLPVRALAVGVLWLVGVIGIRARRGQQWLEAARTAGFEPVSNAPLTHAFGRPALVGTVEDRSVRVEPFEAGVNPRHWTAFRTPIRGVPEEVNVTLNAERDDPKALEPFRVESGDAEDLLTVAVESALMDAIKPGEITISEAEVVYRVPRSRLGPDDLARCARVVALLGNRLEAVRAEPSA